MVESCEICMKNSNKVDYCQLKPVEAVFPFQIVSLDTGFIPIDQDKNHYFVVAINHYSRWIKVKSLKKESSEEIIQFIKDSIVY